MNKFFTTLLLLAGLFQLATAQTKPTEIDVPMVKVEGGTFTMGSTTGEKNEKPPHAVTLSTFYISKYEVTQNQWQAIMGSNNAYFKGCPQCPADNSTLAEVDTFIARLNAITGKHYRLPTEAEWEYAAMGGNKSKGYRYPGSDSLLAVGYVRDNAEGKTHPVGQKQPNELGLYDMAGNVWELCSDYWNPAYYKQSPAQNPRNDTKALLRVTRGGSWLSGPERCYNKARNRNIYDHYNKHNFGFRLVEGTTQ